jgi:hypothetical protein
MNRKCTRHENIHVIHQLTHIHLKRKINTVSGFCIADTVLLHEISCFVRLSSFVQKAERYKKNRENIKVMVVESVMMTSL